MQLWRTSWPAGQLVIARDHDAKQDTPSFFDVPFRFEDWGAVTGAIHETAAARGEIYLATDSQVLRVQNLFDEDVSLHWLHRPDSWASVFIDEVRSVWPARAEELPATLTPEYAEMHERFGPGRIDGRVVCPCSTLDVPTETLDEPRRLGMSLSPQDVWDRLTDPFDARKVVQWAERVELYRCRECCAAWASAQVSHGLAIRYESRRLSDDALDELLSASAA